MVPPEVASDPRMARSADNIAPAVVLALREVILATFEKAEMAVETPIDREVLHGPRPTVPAVHRILRQGTEQHRRRCAHHLPVIAVV